MCASYVRWRTDGTERQAQNVGMHRESPKKKRSVGHWYSEVSLLFFCVAFVLAATLSLFVLLTWKPAG